jgi:hypothetical protein
VRLGRMLGVLNERLHLWRHAGSKLLRDVEVRHAVELRGVSMVHWNIATEWRLAYRVVDVVDGLAVCCLGVLNRCIMVFVFWLVMVEEGRG